MAEIVNARDVMRVLYLSYDANGFVFEDDMPKPPMAGSPPKNRAWSTLSQRAAEEAKKRPGRWLVMLRNVNSRNAVGAINYGKYAHLPSDKYEARSQKTRYGQGYDVLIRVKPEVDQQVAAQSEPLDEWSNDWTEQ